jgi:hypothetical protein
VAIEQLPLTLEYLTAGEKKELTFSILVEYPKEREISGL